MTVSDKERRLVFDYCNKYLTGSWRQVDIDQVDIKALSGGMTNQLYQCSLKNRVALCDNEPRQALLRIYGPSKVDINTDLEIFKHLASAGLGPRLYCTFKEGRFEEYLPSDPLKWQEMTDDAVACVVAYKIAAIHMLDVTSLDKKSNWLIDKYRQHENFIENLRNSTMVFSDYVPESSRLKARQLMEIDFRSEIALLERLFKLTQSVPLVFSHNDLHQNNIILLHDENLSLEERVILIDLEYSSYNFRTFDAANHLCEWCFDYVKDDYPHFQFSIDRFPSTEQQKQFLKNYIDGLRNQGMQSNELAFTGHSSLSVKEMVNILFDEMQPCLMASNLLWAMWAIQSALTSKIRFGYWEMAQSKWDCYLLTKKQYEMHSSLGRQNLLNGERELLLGKTSSV